MSTVTVTGGAGKWRADGHLIARGVAEPYTWTLIAFSGLSALSIPCFFAAGRAARRSDAG